MSLDLIHNRDGLRLRAPVVLNPSGANQMFLAGTLRVDRMDSHGGWAATPADVLLFFTVDGLASPPDLLQTAIRTAMKTASAVNPGSATKAGYARGWAVNTVGTIWHNGILPGTQAILWRPSDGRAWCAPTSSMI